MSKFNKKKTTRYEGQVELTVTKAHWYKSEVENLNGRDHLGNLDKDGSETGSRKVSLAGYRDHGKAPSGSIQRDHSVRKSM